MEKLVCRNYAHRGFSGEYPENTMIAFEKALEAGCEGIENDVHLTKDGVLVIIHDEEIDRTGNASGWVKDMTYEELCKVDFSSKFHDKVGFQKIPTLDEYLQLVKDKDIITNIELKTGIIEYPGIERAVYEKLKEYDYCDKVVISSFNHQSVKRMKEIAPEIKCGLLTATWILDAGEYTASHGFECYHPLFVMLKPENVADLRAHGIEINTWTVNEEEHIGWMIDAKVDGIIGNYPDRVKKLLNERGLR